MHTNLTLEERERFAYIEGRTGEAALLALAIDGEEDLRAQVDGLTSEAEAHDAKITRLEGELEDKDTELATAEEKLGDTIVELRERVEELEAVIEMAS